MGDHFVRLSPYKGINSLVTGHEASGQGGEVKTYGIGVTDNFVSS